MLENANFCIEKSDERGSQTKAGVQVVLILWPNSRLAVLINLVLIKKACIHRKTKKIFVLSHGF